MINKQNNQHKNKEKNNLKTITKIINRLPSRIKEGSYNSRSIRVSDFYTKLKD